MDKSDLKGIANGVDYARMLARARAEAAGSVQGVLAKELPYDWLDAYARMTPHQTNVLRIQEGEFEYLFDFTTDLVQSGVVSADEAVEDRLVAVHGTSQRQVAKRNASRIRGAPLGPVALMAPYGRPNYDRGHFIAHSIGGGLDINLFPQLSRVNRGWSEEGKVFRSMERYCQQRPGTYCFCRPIYTSKTAYPAMIEFGLLKADGELWVNTFPNAVG